MAQKHNFNLKNFLKELVISITLVLVGYFVWSRYSNYFGKEACEVVGSKLVLTRRYQCPWWHPEETLGHISLNFLPLFVLIPISLFYFSTKKKKLLSPLIILIVTILWLIIGRILFY